MASRNAEPKSQNGNSDDQEQLLIFRAEDAVKDKVLKWAMRELSVLVLVGNIAAFFGLAAITYNAFSSILDKSISEAIDKRIDDSQRRIDAQFKPYSEMVDTLIKNIDSQKAQVEQLKIQYAQASENANSTTAMLNAKALELQKVYQTDKAEIEQSQEILLKSSRDIDKEFQEIKENDKDFGESVFEVAASQTKALVKQSAELRALHDIIVQSAGQSKIFEMERIESQVTSSNNKTLVVIYAQSGVDRNEFDENELSTELSVLGFRVSVAYTGVDGYIKSKADMQDNTTEINNVLAENDHCVVLNSLNPDMKPIKDELVNRLNAMHFPVDCVQTKKWDISKIIKDSIKKDDIANAKNMVLLYYLSPKIKKT